MCSKGAKVDDLEQKRFTKQAYALEWPKFSALYFFTHHRYLCVVYFYHVHFYRMRTKHDVIQKCWQTFRKKSERPTRKAGNEQELFGFGDENSKNQQSTKRLSVFVNEGEKGLLTERLCVCVSKNDQASSKTQTLHSCSGLVPHQQGAEFC